MLYQEYLSLKIKYADAQDLVCKLLDEKAMIFQKTQPKSSISDYERVDGGSMVSKTEEYIIEMEQKHINKRLDVAKTLMEDRRILLMHKEEELRKSRSRYDMIFVLKYLDGLNAPEIAQEMQYSETQVYRIIKKIRKFAKMTVNDK